MPGFLRNIILIVLACTLVFNVGCVSSLSHAGGCDSGAVTLADSGDTGGGLQQVSHGGGKVAVYVLAGFLITLAVAVDLLILVATHDDPFPCCRAAIHLCH